MTWPVPRAPRWPRGRALAALCLAGLLASSLVLWSLPGEGGPLAARATLVVAGLGALAALWRPAADGAARPALRVLGSAGLGREARVAVVAVDGRRFLVAAGPHPVELLAELSPEPASDPSSLPGTGPEAAP